MISLAGTISGSIGVTSSISVMVIGSMVTGSKSISSGSSSSNVMIAGFFAARSRKEIRSDPSKTSRLTGLRVVTVGSLAGGAGGWWR